MALRAAVITVSDEVAQGADADRGGPVAAGLLGDLGCEVTAAVVPDDPASIAGAVGGAVAAGARVVVACGGTGIGPRITLRRSSADCCLSRSPASPRRSAAAAWPTPRSRWFPARSPE